VLHPDPQPNGRDDSTLTLRTRRVNPGALAAPSGTSARRLGRPVLVQLQPIIETIAASLHGRRATARRDVSVTLRGSDGRTLVVSVRSGGAPAESLESPGRPGLDARRLRLVIDTINDRIGEPLSVSMLSSVAGLSRSYFSHVFRTSVGRTPHAHIVRLRIRRAMDLMAETNAPLTDIALSAGFSDQAHFANAFRRTTGTTPAKWRKLHSR
jgi:transcriptional regulator GlxA family with amidase domain